MRKKLTPAFCMKATVEPDAKRTLYWDTEQRGFGLLVTSHGHRSFVVQFRAGAKGSKKSWRETIDAGIGLAAARKQARIRLGEIAKGADPEQERHRQAAALAAQADTLQAICEEYLKREGGKLRSLDERRATLERLVYPALGCRPIHEIRRTEINRMLDDIADKRGPVRADYVLGAVRRIMNWHASRTDDFRSPIVRGMARTSNKDRARARVLTDDELRSVWKAAEAMPGPFGALVQFLLLTGARRTEAAAMTYEELNGTDWTLPARRNKVKAELIRPLSAAAIAVIARLPRISGDYVFTSGHRPLGGLSHFKRDFDKRCGVTGWTLHDLRRTARSLMSRAGVASDHAERCLGHVIGGVRGTYDRHEYHPEKKRAYEMLAMQIERIVNPEDNVVALRAAE